MGQTSDQRHMCEPRLNLFALYVMNRESIEAI